MRRQRSPSVGGTPSSSSTPIGAGPAQHPAPIPWHAQKLPGQDRGWLETGLLPAMLQGDPGPCGPRAPARPSPGRAGDGWGWSGCSLGCIPAPAHRGFGQASSQHDMASKIPPASVAPQITPGCVNKSCISRPQGQSVGPCPVMGRGEQVSWLTVHPGVTVFPRTVLTPSHCGAGEGGDGNAGAGEGGELLPDVHDLQGPLHAAGQRALPGLPGLPRHRCHRPGPC